MQVIHGAATDVGLVRRQNEDSFLVGDGIFAVCDGMGGARGGEVASEAACRRLGSLAGTNADADDLVREIQEVNSSILYQSRQDPAVAGMGSTLTAAMWRGDRLIIAHVGDSRAYLLREGRLKQLTRDHSMVAEMERKGELTPGEAAVHPFRSVLTRAVGTEEMLDVDILEISLELGDRVLLCSDGLTGMIGGDEISRLLGEADDPQGAANALVAAAVEGGGEDNVTVVVLFVVGGESDGQEPLRPQEETIVGPTERRVGRGFHSWGRRMWGSRLEGEASSGSDDPGGDGWPDVPDPPSGDAAPAAARPSDSETEKRGPRFRFDRRLLQIIAIVGVAVVILVGGLLIFNSTVYFVGTNEGNVTLFQGLPYSALGMDLYEVEEVTSSRYSDLDPYLRKRIDARELTTKEEGQRFIRGLDADH